MHEDVADGYQRTLDDHILSHRGLANESRRLANESEYIAGVIESIGITTEEIKQRIQYLNDQNYQMRVVLSKLEWRPALVNKLFEVQTSPLTMQKNPHVLAYEEYLLLMNDIREALETPSISSAKVRGINEKIGTWLESHGRDMKRYERKIQGAVPYRRQSDTDNISEAGFFQNAMNTVIYGGTYTVVNPPHADDTVSALRSDVKSIHKLLYMQFFVFL